MKYSFVDRLKNPNLDEAAIIPDLKMRIVNKTAASLLTLSLCFAVFSTGTFACTGIYAGCSTTENGSAYIGRSEDYGPDYGKRFIIVPSADHAEGKMLADDHGFCAPYPAHTLRYSAIIDDPSAYSGLTLFPYAEAGINEKGVSVSATVSTYFNDKVRMIDPLTSGGPTEMSMTSYILQSAKSALDGVRLLADCIDRYGHGNSEADAADSREVSTVYIADREETWIFEIVSGHQYVATRMSDNTVSLIPNAIMCGQINIRDKNIISSPGLISTAKAGGFYVSDTEGDDEIHVAKSYSEGYANYSSYRYYYGAYIMNKDLAQTTDVVPKPAAEIADQYPNASVEETAVGPFLMEYQPSDEINGKINLQTLRQVLASHGEGSAYETSSKNVNPDGTPMRSIGTYKQNEEHIFEIRRDDKIPVSVCTIEWLAMAPSEFSVFIPFYSAAMTEAPYAYAAAAAHDFDPESIYWLFNEIGNAGNGNYYRIDDYGVYHDRYGKEIHAETAEAVLQYLSDSEFIEDLRDFMSNLQEEIKARAVSDDEMMINFAGTASDEEVSVIANQLAYENSAYIKRIASKKLAEIDEYVSNYIILIEQAERETFAE